MPGMSRGTPQITLRIAPRLWEQFGAACTEAGGDRSVTLRALIRWYAGVGELPPRPETSRQG